jgi:copper homeostasis protein
MRKIVFELCAETIGACLAARDGGVDRIELCSGLSEGGLTPSHGLVRAAVEQTGLPVHVLIRPRGGDFLYSKAEIALMKDDILHLKTLGVAGVVLGMLNVDDTVDIEGTRSLVQIAHPLQVTFHRAFDSTPSIELALEDVIATSCDRVLTSGGHLDIKAGAEVLARLVSQARGRIDVALGGGLRLKNAVAVARLTNAEHFHGSLHYEQTRRADVASPRQGAAVDSDVASGEAVDANDVRTMIGLLQNA